MSRAKNSPEMEESSWGYRNKELSYVPLLIPPLLLGEMEKGANSTSPPLNLRGGEEESKVK